jgi:hypothetical protein
MSKRALEIDLAKEKFDLAELSNLNEITSIRFDNYTDKIEIPLAINEYPNITELYVSGNKESSYQTPDNMEKFVHIKKLTLWSYCDFSKLKPMPRLETLHTVVQNTENDTRKLVALFPNLKHLEIWDSHSKNQKLPDEIEQLSSLESLHLVSCGLENLPKSFVKLKQLKELNLRGLPMAVFPEEIVKLENLEILEISQPFVKLPDGLKNLKKLRKLNLNSSLNGANTSVAGSFKQDKLYLKPIPEVIGLLTNLEDLNLAICGVFDITPLFPLKKLKKLNLQYSALKNCDGFSNFKMLEDLNLQTSYDLIDIEGLNALPVKKLNLYGCHDIESIAVISSLAVLEELHIGSCNAIKDFSPLFNHSSIKSLRANTEIVNRWNKKAEYKNLPELDLIISQLGTDDSEQFEQATLHLSQHVKANYENMENPLAGFFGIQSDHGEITEIEILDTAILKHLKNLSNKTLVTIFATAFKSVYDNYNATVLVLNEIIARKDIATQQQIIEKFYEAFGYYDGGHRYWDSTVYDKLIDTIFVQFTSEALYLLLKHFSTDMLHTEGGDKIETLFVPALHNTKDKIVYEKLLNIFFKYEAEARTYFGKEHFENLLQQIKEVGSPDLEQLILVKKEENKEQEEWITLLENLNEQNLPKVVEGLANKIPESIDYTDFNKIINAAKKIKLSESNLEILFDFIIKNKEINQLSGLLVAQYHETLPENIIDYLKAQFEKGILKKESVLYIAEKIIIKLTELNASFEEIEIYEVFAVSYCDVSFDTIYNIEIKALLDKFYENGRSSSQEDLSWVLEKLKTIIAKTPQPKYTDLKFNTSLSLSLLEYEKIRQAFYVLYAKVIGINNQNVLYGNICASIMLNDESYFDLIYREVQKIERISETLLAYNLACAFAHFGRKEDMLFYIKDSIRLGKTTRQFLDDTDFEKYWDDADFLEAIEEK